jgi:hypothetical protein
MSQLGHTYFGITHRCRRIIIDRTKITLTINHWIAQAKILRHTDDGIIDSTIAMWMVLTDHITNHTSRLFVRFIIVV